MPNPLIQDFLKQVPVRPDLVGVDEDDIVDVEWNINGRIILLESVNNATTGRWLTWIRGNSIIKPQPFQDIDFLKPATWTPLLELLQGEHSNS